MGIVILAIATALVLDSPAIAQKGTGETTGVARQTANPPIVSMSGIVKDIKIGTCERTPGRSLTGEHLIVQTDKGKDVNLHLGPHTAVQSLLGQHSVGQRLKFEAFHSYAMPSNAYVAKSVTLDGKLIEFRDNDLHPTWAGAIDG